jgi:GxxExxY protein
MDVAYRVDLMIEGKFIVELKAVKEVTDLHFAQTLSYLKLSGCKLGCLINFHVPLLKNGFRRVVNEL